MMAWSKSQDVLLKLNLLIRKISDYELRFGSQYEHFREKIKYLRTKDDTLCEMGRFQNDLQTKLGEKAKSGFRALIKKETDEESSHKKEAAVDIKLMHLKRQLIKDAYTEQLDAVVELGKKMQIIGEHGKQLLEHIDLTCTVSPYSDGRETEGVLQAARIALENWSQGTSVDTQDTLDDTTPETTLKPTPTVSVSDVSTTAAANGSSKSTKKSATPSTQPVTNVESAAASVPLLPPRTPDRMPSSESLEPRRVQKGRANHRAAEDEMLRRQEELEIKTALEMSLAASGFQGKDISDLDLTPEELLFISEQESPKSNRSSQEDDVQSLAVPKPTGASRVVRGPQSVEIGGHVSSQRRPQPSQTKEDDAKAAKVVSTPALEELGGSRKSSEYMDDQRVSSTSKKGAKTKHMPMESMGSEPEAPLESMGCDSSATLESMGDSGSAAHEQLRLQKILTQQRKHQEQQHPSPFPLSPELQYLQIQPSPQQSKLQISQTAQGNLHLGTPIGSNHSSPMGGGNYQPSTAYRPATTYVPHAKAKNRLSGPITPPNSAGLSPSASQLQQQRQRQQEFQQQLQQSHADDSRSFSLSAKHSLQQQQELQKKLQDFYYTANEQESTERYHQEHSQQRQDGHQRQQPSGSWDYHPDNDGDYQYKEEYHALHR
ncbi:hypothetical protein BGX23_007693 [Mortierella sp. AD031]|nr:hypothetical protein BGX23_007693 [Mortierella sp. AD031]